MRGTQREDIKINKNRISVFDINGFATDETECVQAFSQDYTNRDIYNAQICAFVPVALQGINLGFMSFGATGSGKAQTLEGIKNDPGIIQLFIEDLFKAIQEKSENSTEHYKCSVNLQFVEILNETVTNLLSHKGVGGMALKISMSATEGPSIEADKISIDSLKTFNELFQIGLKNKTQSLDEYGRLADRAHNATILEIIQETGEAENMQTFISRVLFVEIASLEILYKDREMLKAEQGELMNQGLFTLNDFLVAPASITGTKNMLLQSEITKVCNELLGGNALTLAIFHFAYDDQIGSTYTMKLLNAIQKIICYPIQNDNRSMGLLKKYREEINNLRSLCIFIMKLFIFSKFSGRRENLLFRTKNCRFRKKSY